MKDKIILQVGDTFNSIVDTVITIIKIHNSGKRITLKTYRGVVYNEDCIDIINRIYNGTYTNYTPINKKEFKVGDIVTIIPSKELSCTEDFKAKIYKISSSSLYITILKGTFWFGYNDCTEICRIDRPVGYITGSISKRNFKHLQININKDEKTREIRTNARCKEKPTAIKSNSSRKITIGSPLIGNSINNSIKKTRIRELKISRQAISA